MRQFKAVKSKDLSQTERADVLDAVIESLGFEICVEETVDYRKVQVRLKQVTPTIEEIAERNGCKVVAENEDR